MPDTVYIVFLFALGACIGSFLNVVVWRLPRIDLPAEAGIWTDLVASFKGLSDPPSHCPKCNNRLNWFDNIPILGWIKLRGRCRFCEEPISMRYPIVELLTALIFVGYYYAFYMLQMRTCCPQATVLGYRYDGFGIGHEVTNPMWVLSESWPIFFLYLFLLSGLLAASLIDAELYIIPVQIPWLIAAVGFAVHTLADRPAVPGSLNLLGEYGPPFAALSAGAAIGLIISMVLWTLKILPTSFPEGEPLLDVDRQSMKDDMAKAELAGEIWEEGPLPPEYSPKMIRREISKEMLFLLPPLLAGGGFLAATVWKPAIHDRWQHLVLSHNWFNALLGSLLGAMVGGFVVWIIRILGTLAFRRVAMGLGDVHLMFGVGAVIGAGGVTLAFFAAPFFAILTAIYKLIVRRGREIPLGPYLSLATAIVMLCYCPLAAYLRPGLQGLFYFASEMLHRSGR